MRLDPGQIEVMDPDMAEVLKKKEPWERIAIGFGLWTSARSMLASLLRGMHPDWDDERIRREIVRRMSHGSV